MEKERFIIKDYGSSSNPNNEAEESETVVITDSETNDFLSVEKTNYDLCIITLCDPTKYAQVYQELKLDEEFALLLANTILKLYG